MADKHFKVKNNVQVSDLTTAGPVTVDANGVLNSHSTLAIDKGGTGQTTAANAINALLPSQTNNTNKVLASDGTNVNWVNNGAAYQTSAPSSPNVGDLWVDSDETGDSLDPYIIRRKTITATAGQTVFTTDVTFTDGYEQVYYNGVLLVRTTDYTTSGGTNTVTLLQGASAGDTIEIIASTPINLVNAVVTGAANTITAATTTTVPLAIAGLASQTANVFEIKNNAGEIRHQFTDKGIMISRGNSADGSAIIAERYGSDPVAVFAMRGYGGSVSSPLTVSTDMRLGLLGAAGYDGAALRESARITFYVDGQVTSGSVPGRIAFNTAPAGGAHAERMRIDSNGIVYIGEATNYGARLAVNSSGQSSIFIRSAGVGSGQIGFTGSNSVLRIVNTYADGLIANGKGIDINANGNVAVGWSPDNNWRLSVNESGGTGAGAFLSTTNSTSIFAGLFEAANVSYTGVIQRLQTYRSNTSAFRFFDAFSSSTGSADLEFNLRGDGQAYADGSWNAGGADYAEYFEWLDGNINNEDRRGYSVSLVGKKIKVAEEGETPIGVISGNPSIIGDAGWNSWNHKYLVDDFGSYIRDENGERILNPDFDENLEYISREDRPEWAIVGLMGKLRLRKNQIVGDGWIKMDDISAEVEEWLVK